jgi:hypothetical protein
MRVRVLALVLLFPVLVAAQGRQKVLHAVPGTGDDASANGIVLRTEDSSVVTVQNTRAGSWDGTLTYEVTVDGTNWLGMLCRQLSDNTYVASTSSAANIVECPVAGTWGFRARISGQSTGSTVVTAGVAQVARVAPMSSSMEDFGTLVDGGLCVYEEAAGEVNCDASPTAVGADSIGTAELDDGADTPGSGQYLRVDTVDQAGIEYRTVAEVLADIGAESATSNDFDPDRLAGDTGDDNLIDDAIIAASIARDSELPTQASLSVDDLISLSGVAEGATHLSTFTGDTLTDNVTIKDALQLLETAVESAGGLSTDSVGTVELDDDANTPIAGDVVIVEAGAASFDYLTLHAGTNLAADLEEETHASEHAENGNDELLGETLGTACTENQILKANATGGLACAADETGSGALGANLSSTTNDILSDTGSVLLGGTGNIFNENLVCDFELEDEIACTSTTGATVFNLQTFTVEAGAFSGNITGNVTGNADTATTASTATALAANPTDCDPNEFATTIAASGNLTCAALTDTDVPNDITVDLATLASTVTVIDSTDATSFVALFDSATGTLPVKTDGALLYDATTGGLSATSFTGAVTGNASTATALVDNPADCDPNEFATTIAADGDLTCAAIQDADIPATIARDSELPTQATLSVDDLITLSGLAEGATHLGSFTGTTITDMLPIKDALQELETAIEAAGGLGADSVGTDELDDGSDVPAVNELVRVDSASSGQLEYGPCTMTDTGAIDCPAPATDGGAMTLKEGQDDGTDTFSISIPATGLTATVDHEMNASGELPVSVIQRTGSDSTVVTGTAGTSGNLVQWNASGGVADSTVATADVLTTAESGVPAGGIPVVTKVATTSYTIGTTDAAEAWGGVIYVTGAATITAPAIAAGMSFTVITIGAVAVSVDVNASDLMTLDGVVLDDGDKATNTSTTGDILVCVYRNVSGWYCASGSNDGDLWIDGGA